jgi:ADP-heptose:LPS heptosyltransferase
MLNSLSAAPLVIRFGRIGDMVLQTPLLHLLHRRYGRPCRLLTSGPWSTALFTDHPDVAEIWELTDRHAPFLLSPERWKLLFLLRQHRGPIYVSEDSQRQLPKIRRLLALCDIPDNRCLFLDQYPPIRDEHWVDQLLRFGQLTPTAFDRLSPVPSSDQWTAPHLNIRACDRDDREAWLRKRGFDGRPLVLLQPGNKRAIKWGRPRQEDVKAWPVKNWVGLVQAMYAQLPQAVFLLCGAPTERRLLQEIRAAAALARVEIASDDLPLRRLLAVSETAHSMVSVDSGPAHVAAAGGCPLVVLYGVESPARWGRRSPTNSCVTELGGTPLTRSVSEIPLASVIKAWRSAPARSDQIACPEVAW